tara:strand:+ start:1081 stop:1503 length:423 start_codon:yes stop_codon:yes gene_type:complete
MTHNIKNKILIFLVAFFSIFILSFTSVKSESKTKETLWKIGDIVYTLVLCEKEKHILEIAYADSQSRLIFREDLQIKLIQRKCAVFNPPIELKVIKIIGDYEDHNKIRSTIIATSTINNDDIIGYLIIAGRPATDKETTY